MVLFSAPFGLLTGKMLLPCRKSIMLVLPISLAVSGSFLKSACCLCVAYVLNSGYMYMFGVVDLELFHMQPREDIEVRIVLTGYTTGKSNQFFAYMNSILKEAISRIILIIDSYKI